MATSPDIVLAAPETRGSKIITRPHLGLGYLASFLAHSGCQPLIHKVSRPVDLTTYVRMLSDVPSPAYGLSVTDDTLVLAIAILSGLRTARRDAKLLVGGALGKAEAAHFLLSAGYCDAVVVGEGELPILAWLSDGMPTGDNSSTPGVATWSHSSNDMRYVPSVQSLNLNSYPSPILNGWISKDELLDAGIFSSRGCFYRCTYCSFAATSEWKTRYYDDDRFLAELDYIATQHSNKSAILPIWDDVFTLASTRAKRLLQEMITRKLPLRYWVQTRVDRLDEELVALLAQAGVSHVGVGLETASPAMLKTLKKVRLKNFDAPGLAPEEAHLEKFRQLKRWCASHNLPFSINVIIGAPGESREQALATIAFVHELKPLFYFHNIFRLYTGTPLARTWKETGLTVDCINTESPKFPGAVGARVLKHEYDVSSVPPLPMRKSPPVSACISGEVRDRRDNDCFIICEGNAFPSSELSDGYEVLTLTRRTADLPERTATHELSETDVYTSSGATGVPTVPLVLVGLSRIAEFITSLAARSPKNESRFAKEAETILALQCEDAADWKALQVFADVTRDGGTLMIPDGVLSLQFRGILLYDACRFAADCAGRDGWRYSYQKNSLRLCSTGPAVASTNPSTAHISALEDRRGCLRCAALSHCSRCSAIPSQLENVYCSLQRNEVPIRQFVRAVAALLASTIDVFAEPDRYQEGGELVFPRFQKLHPLVFVARIGDTRLLSSSADGFHDVRRLGRDAYRLLADFWRFGPASLNELDQSARSFILDLDYSVRRRHGESCTPS